MIAVTDQQITVSLDTRVPLEAVVLQRLYRLPERRQSEWLRQLVLVGFRNECQTLKSGWPTTTYEMTSNRHYGQAAIDTSSAISRTRRVDEQPQHSQPIDPAARSDDPTRKPFSHLKQVIGDA